jgi:hypothetical protein
MMNMKKIVFVLIVLSAKAIAQPVTITASMESFNGSYAPSYKVIIPHAGVKDASKAWISFLKKHDGKTDTDDSEINAEHVVFAEGDTFQVYSRVATAEGGSVLTAAFMENGQYIKEENTSEAQLIMRLLKDFATPVAKEGLEDKVSDAEKAVRETERDIDFLEKENERMKKSNKHMEQEIHDNERKIKENEDKSAKLRGDLDGRKNALQSVKQKGDDLK